MNNDKNNQDAEFLDFVKDFEKKKASSDAASKDEKETGGTFAPSGKFQPRGEKLFDSDEYGIDDFLKTSQEKKEIPVKTEEPAHAEEPMELKDIKEQEVKPADTEIKDDIKEKIAEAKRRAEEIRSETRHFVKESKAEIKETMKEVKEDIKKDELHTQNLVDVEFKTDKGKKAFNTADFICIDSTTGDINEIADKIMDEQLPKEKLIRDIKPEPELSKKELKAKEKERIIKEKRDKTENEEADKLKWNTYHNGFVFADGEKIIKEYNCLKLVNPSGNGVITITNKRLLCSANELAETELDNITGIVSKYKSRFSFGKLLLFLIIGVITAAFFVAAVKWNYLIDVRHILSVKWRWLKYAYYVLGSGVGIYALVLLFSLQGKEFNINIFIKASTPLVSYRGVTGQSAKSYVIRVKPGKESKHIVHEIGAVLLEVKSGKY